jgi:hypothetical protein
VHMPAIAEKDRIAQIFRLRSHCCAMCWQWFARFCQSLFDMARLLC